MTHDLSTETDADLVALVGSRLCHDLISPLGAIGNGVELLAMTGMSGPELQMIEESVAVANAKVKFFRIAFGRAATDQLIPTREVTAVLADYARNGRVRYDWLCSQDMPRNAIKMAFLAILCIEPVLPRGGCISITQDAREWHILGTGPQIRPAPAVWAALDGQPLSLTPAQVQYALLARETVHTQNKLSWCVTETTAEIWFRT